MLELGENRDAWGVFVGNRIASHYPLSVAVFDSRSDATKFARELQLYMGTKCTVKRVTIQVSAKLAKRKAVRDE